MPDVIAGTNPRVQFRGTDGEWHDLNVARVELSYTHEAPIAPQPHVGDVSLSFTVHTDGARKFNAFIRRLRRKHACSVQKHVCSVMAARLRAQFPRLTTAQIDRLARVIKRKRGRPVPGPIANLMIVRTYTTQSTKPLTLGDWKSMRDRLRGAK